MNQTNFLTSTEISKHYNLTRFKSKVNHYVNLILINTTREREINVGSKYPYETMKKGQCLPNIA